MSSRSASRGRNGRFAVSPSQNRGIDQQDVLARPRSRRNTSAHQGGSWLSSVFPIWGRQTRGQTDLDKTIRRVYSQALAFSWIIGVLHTIARLILWVVAFFLFKNLVQGDIISQLAQVLGSCYTATEGSCSSKVSAKFFNMNQAFAWVSVRLDTMDLASTYSQNRLFNVEFYVYLDNPITLLTTTVGMAVACWFLGRLHNFLTDVIDTTTAADPP